MRPRPRPSPNPNLDSMDELRADMRRLLMLQQLSDVMDRGGPMPQDTPGAPPLPPPPTTQPPPETVARRRTKGNSQMGLGRPTAAPEAATTRTRNRVRKGGDEAAPMPGAMPGAMPDERGPTPPSDAPFDPFQALPSTFV